MNASRFLTVFKGDLALTLRRPMFWVWVAVLLLFAWAFSTGTARIQSGDSSVGGVKSHLTSEFAVSMQTAILTAMVYGFFASVVAGMAVIHDDESRVGELLHATPLRPGEYVWAKFLAVVVAALGVLAIHMAATVVFNHVLPAGSAREFRGAFHARNYLRPALLFNVPTVIFMAGVSFAVGERTRRPVLVFFLPVAVFLGCGFFLWDWSPSWLDPRIDKFLMLIDPGAFRWLNETWLKVDRGARFYNSATVPLDALFVANRLIVLALGLGAVAWSRRHLASVLRGTSRRAERAWSRRSAVEGRGGEADPSSAAPPRPLSALGMTSRPPGLFAAAWTVAKAEAVELRSSPGLYLFIPLLVLEAFAPNLVAIGPFDTALLMTPGTLATRTFGALTVMLCLLLMFYAVESLGREQHTRLAAISHATPLRTGSLLLGKALAIGLVALVVGLLEFVVEAAFLVYQGTVPVAVWPFALVWGLLLVPTVWLWTIFIMATLSITRNRYATYAVGLAALMVTGYRTITGKNSWVGNWPMLNTLRWSDISILEFDRRALVVNRVFVVGLAVFLTALTTRFHGRREGDATRLIHRLSPWPLFVAALRLAPFAVVPLAAWTALYVMVDRGTGGDQAKSLGKDYWRKNMATYYDQPLPDVTAADLDVTLDPARSFLKVKGTIDLVNNGVKPLRQIQLTGGLHWRRVSWSYDGAKASPDNRSGLYVFTLEKPLRPGGTARIGFAFDGVYPDGVSKNGGGSMQFILPSGVVLTTFGTAFAPALGFAEGVGVDDENKTDSKEYTDDFYVGQTESALGSRMPFKTRIAVTGPADFTYNSVGTAVRDEVKGGLRTTVWESDHPVNFFNIVAGRWAVRRGAGTAVYYHPAHAYNVGAMVEALDAARQYYSEWFRPFPWKELKLSEFPALASYAQGFPTDITFSESIGFLSKSDKDADVAFIITAHEAAHQWWGNLICPGKGPGGNILSEGTSHFSTLLLFEQVKGPHARIEFAKKIEDDYANSRQSDSERPLVKIDGDRPGDTAVTYDKGGFAFWMLMNHMGRDRCLKGIRAFFDTYHDNPDHPVIQDFLAVLREHADDPKAFDAFTRQWFFEVVVPEYVLENPKRVQEGKAWKSTVNVRNVGTGTMPVEIAAVKGDRFLKDGAPNPDYRESRTTVILGAGAARDVTISGDFSPEKLVVDPDAKVLQLRRKAATASF